MQTLMQMKPNRQEAHLEGGVSEEAQAVSLIEREIMEVGGRSRATSLSLAPVFYQ